jgi:hypothetical protein
VELPLIFLEIRLGGDHIGAVARLIGPDADFGELEGGHGLRL